MYRQKMDSIFVTLKLAFQNTVTLPKNMFAIGVQLARNIE